MEKADIAEGQGGNYKSEVRGRGSKDKTLQDRPKEGSVTQHAIPTGPLLVNKKEHRKT